MSFAASPTNVGAQVSGGRLTTGRASCRGAGGRRSHFSFGMSELMKATSAQPVGDRAAVDDTGQSVDPVDLSGDAVRERVGAGQKRVVSGFKLDQPDVLFDALTLHLSRSR